MILLDGKKARAELKLKLKERITDLSHISNTPIIPTLALIQVGDVKESSIYVSQKILFAESVGAKVIHIKLSNEINFNDLVSEIKKHNDDSSVHGIIVQLPLPAHLDKDAVIEIINPLKDVDGLTDENQNLLVLGQPRFIPATAKGIMTLLDFYHIDVKDKKVCVLGRSKLVGSPVAKMLTILGAKVSVCHSQTDHPEEISKTADILISAIGKPHHIDISYLKENAVVIDVGLTHISGKGGVSDVDRKALEGHIQAITPVIGGVGPMTVLSLFDNLIHSVDLMTKKTNG